MLTLTASAEKAIGRFIKGAESPVAGMRISVTGGGCFGMQYALADRLVFRKVREAVGGRMRFFVSGGAPLAPALNRFFYSIGLTILEGPLCHFAVHVIAF